MKCDKCIYEEEERTLLLLYSSFEDACEIIGRRGDLHRWSDDEQYKVKYILRRDYRDQNLLEAYLSDYSTVVNAMIGVMDHARMFRRAIKKLPCNCHRLEDE